MPCRRSLGCQARPGLDSDLSPHSRRQSLNRGHQPASQPASQAKPGGRSCREGKWCPTPAKSPRLASPLPRGGQPERYTCSTAVGRLPTCQRGRIVALACARVCLGWPSLSQTPSVDTSPPHIKPSTSTAAACATPLSTIRGLCTVDQVRPSPKPGRQQSPLPSVPSGLVSCHAALVCFFSCPRRKKHRTYPHDRPVHRHPREGLLGSPYPGHRATSAEMATCRRPE